MKISFIGQISLTAIFMSLLTGYAYAEDSPNIDSSIDADELAHELTADGWTLYGTDQCGWCIRQKEEFGDAFGNLTYINCMENRSACIDSGITSIPCWASPNGTLHPGYHNLTRLSELVSDYQRAHPTPTPTTAMSTSPATIGFEPVFALTGVLTAFLMRRR